VSGLADEEKIEREDHGAGASPESIDEVQATLESMLGAIREAKVGELILSTVSTLASVAYGKLESRELGDARLAIDAVGALLPLLSGEIDDAIRRDFDQALTNLRIAYANAVATDPPRSE